MRAYRGVDVWIHIFLTSAQVGSEWLASRPCRFTRWERAPDSHWIGGWWTSEPVWTTWRKEKSWPYRDSELRILGRPILSQSLNRLRYPGSLTHDTCEKQLGLSFCRLVCNVLCRRIIVRLYTVDLSVIIKNVAYLLNKHNLLSSNRNGYDIVLLSHRYYWFDEILISKISHTLEFHHSTEIWPLYGPQFRI
jgi:hypothetical protein